MRLIDADALRKNAQHAKDISKWDGELLVVGLGHILNAPTIESPRPDWTPCAEGTNLPKDGVYDVTLKNENGTLGVVTGFFVDGAWANTGLYASANIIAYMPKPDPYRADQKEDAE